MTTTTPQNPMSERDTRALRTVEYGSITDSLTAAGAIVLAIIGLAGILPRYAAAVAVIAFGVAMLTEGGAITTRYAELVAKAVAGSALPTERPRGTSAETFAGYTGIVLGILALVGVAPTTLLPVAVIVFGAGLLFGREAMTRIDGLSMPDEQARAAMIAHEAAAASSGAQVLVGVAAVVLGILALIGLSPLVLSLVALLGLGGSALLSGTTLGAEIARALPH